MLALAPMAHRNTQESAVSLLPPTYSTQRKERRHQRTSRNQFIPLPNSWFGQTFSRETPSETGIQTNSSQNLEKKTVHSFSGRNIFEPRQGTNQRRPFLHLYKHLSTFRFFPSPIIPHQRTGSQPSVRQPNQHQREFHQKPNAETRQISLVQLKLASPCKQRDTQNN